MIESVQNDHILRIKVFISNERNKFAKELNIEFKVFDIDIIAAKSSELHLYIYGKTEGS